MPVVQAILLRIQSFSSMWFHYCGKSNDKPADYRAIVKIKQNKKALSLNPKLDAERSL
jgi:hypothetical protein